MAEGRRIAPRFIRPRSAFDNPDVPPSTDPFYAGLGQAVRIGTELLASVIVGGGFGWVVDTYLLGSSPWGIVIGLILGVAAGIRNAYRRAQEWTTGPPGGPPDDR